MNFNVKHLKREREKDGKAGEGSGGKGEEMKFKQLGRKKIVSRTDCRVLHLIYIYIYI